LIFFVQQEPEPEPEPRARIRFRFFLGQNDTVPTVPVPVPQHCLRVSLARRKGKACQSITRIKYRRGKHLLINGDHLWY
jgi:hypothetical protein